MRVNNVKKFIAAIPVILCLWQIAQAQQQPIDVDANVASKLMEVEKLSDNDFSTKVKFMLDSLDRDLRDSRVSGATLLVYLYGDKVEMANQKKLFLNSLDKKNLYHTWITIVEGETCKSTTTIFWKLPRKVEYPQVCESDHHKDP